MRALVGRRRSSVFAAAVATAYVVAWVLAFAAGQHLSDTRGFVVWHFAGALDVCLFLLCGWRMWPLVPVAAALRFAIFGDPFGLSLGAVVAEEAIVGLWYALCTRIVVGWVRVRFPLATLRDVVAFAAIVAIAAPAGISLFQVWFVGTQSDLVVGSFFAQYANALAGTATAMLVLVPAVTTLLRWSETRIDVRSRQFRRDLLGGIVALIAIVGASYARFGSFAAPLGDFAFLPLGWLAIRCGMRGAIIGILVADVSSSAFFLASHAPTSALVGYQLFLLASAVMALGFGVTTEERATLLERIEHDALYDPLTDLPKRELLARWWQSHGDAAMRLILLDIDDLRRLNEGIGRSRADKVVQEFAQRLVTLGAEYFVARISSEDFVAIALTPNAIASADATVSTLLEEPFDIGRQRLYLTASIGIADVKPGEKLDDVLRHADIALRRAKETAVQAAVYSTELLAAANPLLADELHEAFERGEFVPFFQPILRFDPVLLAWETVGAEALLRWRHPQRGVLTPAHFLDMLERLSLSDRVAWSVMEESLRFASRMRAHIPKFCVWVNLFTRQALSGTCASRIAETLARTKSSADALVVEVSERTVASDDRNVLVDLVVDLNTLGVGTAIDDFGTGDSSLGRVRDVPASILKIDKSFVTRSDVDFRAKTVASTIVRLGSELGMSVLAEGVENANHVTAMLDIGCEYAQGYAFGHPVPADLFERALKTVA